MLLLTDNEAKEQHRQEPSLSTPRAPKPSFYRPRERVKRGQRKEREPVCTGWCSLLPFRGDAGDGKQGEHGAVSGGAVNRNFAAHHMGTGLVQPLTDLRTFSRLCDLSLLLFSHL